MLKIMAISWRNYHAVPKIASGDGLPRIPPVLGGLIR
jgi:hypothetical protein